MNPSTLQFIIDALRTSVSSSIDLSVEANRKKLSTREDTHFRGRPSVRNADGTSLSAAQIAAVANMTMAEVTALMRSI